MIDGGTKVFNQLTGNPFGNSFGVRGVEVNIRVHSFFDAEFLECPVSHFELGIEVEEVMAVEVGYKRSAVFGFENFFEGGQRVETGAPEFPGPGVVFKEIQGGSPGFGGHGLILHRFDRRISKMLILVNGNQNAFF